ASSSSHSPAGRNCPGMYQVLAGALKSPGEPGCGRRVWGRVMRARKIVQHGLLALGVPLVMASVLAGPGLTAASAATCSSWAGLAPPSPGSVNHLNGVVAISSCRVYAVGQYWDGSAYQTLAARWNGTGWKQQASPNPAGSTQDNVLNSVAAASSGNAWAVGYYGSNSQTLVEHWNGSAWKQAATPSPGTAHDNFLSGVTVVSASNVWAVGYYDNGTVRRSLVEHWNGSTWKVVASPNPGGASASVTLVGVAAVSASNIWAVGSGTGQTLIEHWNGSTWQRVASPTPNGL